MNLLLRAGAALLAVSCVASGADAGPLVVTALPGGPFADASGNSVTIVPNPIDDLADAYPLALLKDVQVNETIAVGFTLESLFSATSGVLPLLEGISNNSASAWSSLLLTALAPSGGAAGFLGSGFAMTQPGSIVVGPEIAPGVVAAALLSFDTPVLPGQEFLFAFTLLYDISSVNDLTPSSIAFVVAETPDAVPEPAALWLLAPAAVAMFRRMRQRRQ